MPQPIVFGSAEAKDVLKRNRLLDGLTVFCPQCFDWDDADRRLCALCDGEGVLSAWEVLDYLRPSWMAVKRKAYIKALPEQDPQYCAMAAVLEQEG